MGRHLAAVLLAALRPQGRPVPSALRAAVEDLTPGPEHERIAAMLATGELRLLLLGALAQRHPAWSEIRALAAALAEATGARLGYLPEGGNAVGAALAGATPHRGHRRTSRRAARSARGRDARRRSQGVRAGGRDRE